MRFIFEPASEANAGIAVQAEDAPALANAVLKLYTMSAKEREIIGQNGRTYYKEHFDHDRLTERLIDHLHELPLILGKINESSGVGGERHAWQCGAPCTG